MKNYIEEFKKYLSFKKNHSQNTINSYISDINIFIAYIEKQNVDIFSVGKKHIISYMSYLNEQGKSAATTARALASLRLYYHFLMLNGKININPCEDIKTPQTTKKVPHTLSFEEIDTLLSAPDISTKKGMRDKAILELLYATGMRASEIIMLKVSDINLELNYCICASESKNRLIPFGKKATEAIKNYIDCTSLSAESYLFCKNDGCPLSRQAFWKIIKSYANKAGIDSNINPSVLRNSFAYHMLFNGADIESVQELMGFSDINSLNIYGKVNKKRIMDVYSSAHPRA